MLLDINLPDGSGLEVLRKIRHQQPDAVVIMDYGQCVSGRNYRAHCGVAPTISSASQSISKNCRLQFETELKRAGSAKV